MKNILFLVIILSFTIMIPAQTWQWANTAGSIGNDVAGKSCIDLSCNIYTGGGVSSINPASAYFNTDTFQINGESDMFIVKYDANGNELWVKSFGGNNSGPNSASESITDMYFDSSSNSIYLSGYFFGICNFGSYTLTTCGGTDFFIARMDLDGNFLWVKKGCGVNNDKGGKLTSDNAGSLYVTGLLSSGGNLDSISLPFGVFFAKYDIDGNVIWAKKITEFNLVGTGHYSIGSILHHNNQILMYGRAIVDSLTIDTMSFNAQNYKGVILTKWDVDGNILWGKRFGGPGYSIGSMDIDNNGNFYLNGWYSTSFAGNYATFDNDTLFATGPAGGFYIKMDNSGNKIWLKNINSSQYHVLITNSVNSDGSSYLGGRFADTLYIDNTSVASQTIDDAFVAQFDANGNVVGVVNFGEGQVNHVLSENNNDFIITGFFRGTVNFDVSHTSHGINDMFIAKHDAITRIEELRTVSNQLLIYANPNRGTCTITVPDEFLNEKNLLLQIYDTAGKLLQQSKIEIQQDKIKVNIEAEAKGVYPVVLTNGKKSYNGKIVFE